MGDSNRKKKKRAWKGKRSRDGGGERRRANATWFDELDFTMPMFPALTEYVRDRSPAPDTYPSPCFRSSLLPCPRRQAGSSTPLTHSSRKVRRTVHLHTHARH